MVICAQKFWQDPISDSTKCVLTDKTLWGAQSWKISYFLNFLKILAFIFFHFFLFFSESESWKALQA